MVSRVPPFSSATIKDAGLRWLSSIKSYGFPFELSVTFTILHNLGEQLKFIYLVGYANFNVPIGLPSICIISFFFLGIPSWAVIRHIQQNPHSPLVTFYHDLTGLNQTGPSPQLGNLSLPLPNCYKIS